MTKRSLFKTIICILFAGYFSPMFGQGYGNTERGIAVYYADYLEGQPTAYGEVYRRDEMTAAHRTYPAGTLLKVTRLDNQRSVVVRVNDRGPFCDNCVVELSKIAAVQLDLLRAGRATVAVDIVGSQQSPVTAANTSTRGIALYETPANPHSAYPRPDAGYQPRSVYSKSAPVAYGDEQAVRINPNATPNSNAQRAQELQQNGLNAYNQIEAFDSYNYYQAQQVERKSVENYNAPSQSDTYERLRARGLLPEAPASNDNAAFNSRGGISQPSSYDQSSQRIVVPSPSAEWNNTQASTARPSAYNSESSATRQFTPRSVAPRGDYAIQMASYRNFDNAQRQLQKLKQLGLGTAYLLETSMGGGKLYKVLNGPFSDKETAMNELSRYKQDLLVDGIVIMLK